MTTTRIDEQTRQVPLRLWPGVALVVLQWLLRFGLPILMPDALAIGAIGTLLCGVAIAFWWAFFSRAPRLERWGGVILMIVALVATKGILHESLATGGMGMIFYIYAIPLLSLAFVIWAIASRRLAAGPRRAAMVMTILLACGVWALVRTGGFTGAGNSDLAWRWAETPEERLVAQGRDEPMAAPASAATEADSGMPGTDRVTADWPGFRGPSRDGIVRDLRIETDWATSPPVELWRKPIGPGWSSFAVRGDRVYTQEQRGDEEIVAGYDKATGNPVWRHRDATRFWESNAGAGPRGTPTLSEGRVYSFGATGILNALDADDGAVVWSRNVASDADEEVPHWGFSSSPLVTGDVVIVAAKGKLVAYGRATGELRWTGPDGGASYSSPHLLSVDGVPQVLLLSGDGATSVAPADGTLLWQHPWPGYPILQPVLTAIGDILISIGDKSGIRRIAVANGAGGWTAEERWTSTGLKPYFNDFVVHEGHAFGFDGSILACIDVEDGKRKWKGGRYGYGQLLLLADQDLLLVLSEKGELALVEASPDRFTELARLPAIKGKTWNHPVLVGGVLLARNSQEMVAFRLALADSPSGSVASASMAAEPPESNVRP